MEPNVAFFVRMKQLLGPDYPAFEKCFSENPRRGLRQNSLKMQSFHLPIILSPIPWCSEGFYYENEARPGKHPYFDAGVYYIQEPSAMAVGAMANAMPGEWVLDLCAAPGGKTSHLASHMAGHGFLLANEIISSRAKILSQNVERMGIQNCAVTNETPARLAARFPEQFDLIVVDAPCSGEGMFRRDEIAVTEWTPDVPAMCAARQDEILDEAVKMLRPGGRLVYSTCTFAPIENEGTISRLLARHPEFEVVPSPYPFDAGHPE